jgi:hypothetical protein
MNLVVWSMLLVLPVGVVVIAGRPPMEWSDHRRALRTLKRQHEARDD